MTPPPSMEMHDKMRLRAAAYRATKVLPSAVAELVAKEILCWEEFGYRLGRNSTILRAVKEIMDAPLLETERRRPPETSAVGYGG